MTFRLLPGVVAPELLTQMFTAIDINGNGVVDYNEFVEGFQLKPVKTAAGTSFERTIIEQACDRHCLS